VARNHCVDTVFFRARVVRRYSNGTERADYYGPYSTKGMANAQITRERRLADEYGAHEVVLEKCRVEITEPIVWKDAE